MHSDDEVRDKARKNGLVRKIMRDKGISYFDAEKMYEASVEHNRQVSKAKRKKAIRKIMFDRRVTYPVAENIYRENAIEIIGGGSAVADSCG